MEDLSNALLFDHAPDSWERRAYPSMATLAAWFSDLLLCIKELVSWTSDFCLPNVVWLSGFFNPQSFLTAIEQSMARKNEWPLDKMPLSVDVTKKNKEYFNSPPREGAYVHGLFMEPLSVDVTKKNKEDFNSPPREGAYVHGLFMEGARWDKQTGMIADSRLKELTPNLPVL